MEKSYRHSVSRCSPAMPAMNRRAWTRVSRATSSQRCSYRNRIDSAESFFPIIPTCDLLLTRVGESTSRADGKALSRYPVIRSRNSQNPIIRWQRTILFAERSFLLERHFKKAETFIQHRMVL